MRRILPLLAIAALTACGDRSNAADTAAAAGATSTASGQTTSAIAGGAVLQGLVDPNTASREQLASLPLDSSAANALMAGRPYADMLAVDSALSRAGMNETQRKAVYVRLFKPIDLNTAKGAEILLIPGVGPRMRHEFEEYRPYTSIEQFRREIGKYVDKTEVARLEQYVTIK